MRVSDKEEAKYIFLEAYLCDDRNKNNYSEVQFEKAWNNWTGFYVIDRKCFAGIRRYGSNLRRIFDRYFVYPEARLIGLNHSNYAKDLLKEMLLNCDAIPFFSIEYQKAAIIEAVNKFNDSLNENYFEVLEDKYITSGNSHQWIAVKTGYVHEIEKTLVKWSTQ